MTNGPDRTAYHLQELAIALDPKSSGHILPDVSLGSPLHILDVGCGAGQTLIALGLADGSTAVGIDVDPSGLSLGRTLTDRISFVAARAERMPLRSASFDMVISRVALPYTDFRLALAEIFRVLRPGGSCWLVLHPPRYALRQLMSHLRRRQFAGAVYQLYVLVNGVVMHTVGRQFRFPFGQRRIESVQTKSGTRSALGRQGFVDIRIPAGKFFVATARKSS